MLYAAVGQFLGAVTGPGGCRRRPQPGQPAPPAEAGRSCPLGHSHEESTLGAPRAVFTELWVTRMGNENNCDWFNPSGTASSNERHLHDRTCTPEQAQCIKTFQ